MEDIIPGLLEAIQSKFKEKFDERVETRLVSSDKLNKTWEEMGLGAVPLPEPERVTQLEKWSSNDHSK